MKKLLLLIVVIGALFAYTSYANGDGKINYTEEVGKLFDKWFDTVGAEEAPKEIASWEVIGPVKPSEVVSDSESVAITATDVRGTNIDGGYMFVGVYGTVDYSWSEGITYKTEEFMVLGDGVSEGSYFSVSIIDINGNTELLDVLQMGVRCVQTGEEYTLDNFRGVIFDTEGGEATRYEIYARMPEVVAAQYQGKAIVEISVKIDCHINTAEAV